MLKWLAIALAVAVVWPIEAGGLVGGVVVSGHSMEPTLMPGDLVVVKRVDEAEVGDIVVYRPPTEPAARVVHRVVERDGDALELQGDNNDWRDPFAVSQDDVIGEVLWHAPKLGGMARWLGEPQVWLSLLLLGSGWLLLNRRREERA